MSSQTPPHETTTGHHARTTSSSYVLRNIEGAPFSRSDCWIEGCRATWQPYMTVRLFLGRAEPVTGDVIYVSAACHDWFGRPWELSIDARAWLWGEP